MARVYTIPSGEPFLDILAQGVLGRWGGEDPLALAGAEILLPTRRATRILMESFARAAGGALLLPAIRPIGDVDEEELVIDAGAASGPSGALDIPPAIDELDRQLALANMIAAWSARTLDRRFTLAEAIPLARDLGAFIDSVETQRADLARLKNLVPEAFAEHWQQTLAFLQIITDLWPDYLAARRLLNPAERRNRALAAQTARWREAPPGHPVIAAGSTGSIPATAELLAEIARLPEGAVILPGLDLDLDDAGWAAVGPEHPQYGMKQLLERMGVTRAEVELWHDAEGAPPAARTRSRILSEALRPADTTDHWATALGGLRGEADAAMAGVHLVEAPGAREEAQAIALIMRGVLEAPGRTAALITPDRNLGRRVAAELQRWQVPVNDSAGTPLDQTPPGLFLRLMTDALIGDLYPVDTLALLKHPLMAAGYERGRCRALVRRLEQAILRGPAPGPTFEDWRAALEAAEKDPEYPRDYSDLISFVDRLRELTAPLQALADKDAIPLADAVRCHLEVAEALAAEPGRPGGNELWAEDAGEAAGLFAARLLEEAEAVGAIDGAAYGPLFGALMAGRPVRPRYSHPRLAILGPLEARLLQADVVILGGLNEGTWPAEAPTDPWLSRPMARDLGLELPERRIGLAAHDFHQAACAPTVYLTRAGKMDGAPTVPSRWLLRLEKLLEGLGHNNFAARAEAHRWLSLAEALDRPAAPPQPAAPPAPRPPLAARPRRLSVTQIETLIRDPYAIYARHVLKLRALDPLNADPGAAERGTIIHDIMERFIEQHKDGLPPDALGRLLEMGRTAFDSKALSPDMRAIWLPRFADAARWFVEEFEPARRAAASPLAMEAKGEWRFEAPGGPFTLSAKADRIDRLHTGGLSILDYKTGTPPSDKQVEAALSPQLPLEAVIASSGGFEGVDATPVGELVYVRLSGGRTGGEARAIAADTAELAREAADGLKRLIAQYDDPHTPYLSRPRPVLVIREGDYDHLARVKEWAAAEGGE